jgi:hypothetical protein
MQIIHQGQTTLSYFYKCFYILLFLKKKCIYFYDILTSCLNPSNPKSIVATTYNFIVCLSQMSKTYLFTTHNLYLELEQDQTKISDPMSRDKKKECQLKANGLYKKARPKNFRYSGKSCFLLTLTV